MAEQNRRRFMALAATLPAAGAVLLPGTAAAQVPEHERPWIRTWIQTPASGIGDVTVGYDGRVWVAGRNGTI